VPEYQQFSILRQVSAGHQDGQAGDSAGQPLNRVFERHRSGGWPKATPPRSCTWKARTTDDVRTTVEYLARNQDHLEYLAGTWLRELAVKLAACDGITVSAVSYDDTAAYELEVTLVSAPHHDPIVIGRSRSGPRQYLLGIIC